MNTLVTGANGQLGNEMRRVAAESSDNYTFTDVAELDITDIDAVCAKVKETEADVIVNCAAYTNVDKAEDGVARADLINNQAAGNLAYAAKEAEQRLFTCRPTTCLTDRRQYHISRPTTPALPVSTARQSLPERWLSLPLDAAR